MSDSSKPFRSRQSEIIGDQVRIFQRGNMWYANYQSDGKQQRKSLKTRSKKEARRQAIRLAADLQDGKINHAKKSPSIASVTKAYLAYLRTERRAPKTIQKIDLVVRRVIDLAARRRVRLLAGVDLSFIDAYRSERVKAGTAPRTVLTETVIVRQIVNFALSRRLLTEDPLDGLKLKKVKSPEQPCWTRETVDQILATAEGSHRNALFVLAECGLRVGELKWLKWDDIDLENNVVHIRPKSGWQPKTGDQRVVPISPALRQHLAGLPRASDWLLSANPSRCYPDTGRQISERRLLQYLKLVLKKLGVRGHLHTFRHSFVTNALIQGVPEAVVRSWVGHVDTATMRIYTHVNSQASQAAMQQLSAESVDNEEK